MKKIFTKLFLLATLFLASTNLSAQTYIINDSGSYEVMNGWSQSKTKTFTISNPRPCDKLTFTNSQSGAATGGVTVTATYVDGSSAEIASNKGNGTHTINLDRKIVKELSFKGTWTLSKKISNIKLTMATYADAPDATEWTAPTATVGSPDESASTTMEWCNTSPFTLSMTGDESQFTYSISNNASAGNYGTATITATYKHNKVGTHKATLTIKTALGNHDITLIGTTTKKNSSITWNLTETKLPKGKIVENAAKANSGNTVTYTTSNDTVIKVINDGTALQAVGLGTAEITATVAENDEWFGASDKKTFTVTNKTIQTIAWNDNLTRLKVDDEQITLSATVYLLVDAETNEKTYSEERTARLTYTSADDKVVSVSGNVLNIVGEGETTLTAHVAGDENYEEASVVIPVKVRQLSTGCDDVLLLNYPTEIEFFEMNTGQITKGAIALNTSVGVPGQLTFQHKGEYWTLGIKYYKGSIKAQQSIDGGNNWSDIAGSEVTPTVGTYKSLTVSLDRRATHIRFVRPEGGEGYHYINAVVVTPAQYLETSVSSISENAIIGDIITKDITINYANMKDEVMLSNTHDDVQLSTTGLGNDCGAFGTATIQVTIKPTQIGTITDEIVIADAVSGKQVRIPVNVAVNRNTQTITWEQDLANIHTTDNITLNAKAKTEVYYTSSDSTIAYAEGNVLKINKYGQFTLTAVAPQDENYEQATVDKEITINTVRPTVSAWPTVEPIAYAQALTTDMLIGGEAEVEGYFDWNTELNQTLVPNTYDLAVRFIPTNANYYAPVDGKVSVTINKSAQSIIWNDSFDNITVTDSIVLNASAQTQVTYEVSDMEIAYITENNVLYFLHGGKVHVTAYAEEDAYYLATETVRELTILPAKPNILVKPNATAITYGQTIGESFLEGGEASVLGTFNWLDSLAMPNAGTYWQYVRFTPDDQESFKPVDFQVEVHVNKAPQTITWELTNFVMKVGDILNLTAVATSGLEVTYTLDDDTYAEINNNVLTALQVGTVTVTASQDGTYVDEFGDEYTNYFAAESVLQTITIVAKDVNTGTDLTFPEVKATKIIRDGRLYIIRNGHTYNVNGQVVE
ncbi:MAG: hypothetical protein IJX48_04415 [Paludibacteraceae bacterium]|nr:hypothetical protein [Paludibacteraceae bacterium]